MKFYAIVTALVAVLICFPVHIASPVTDTNISHTNHHDDYVAIHRFLDKMLTPDDCAAGMEYVWSDMGCGGGFASHFQLAASMWMRAAAITQYRMPVIIVGQIWKYSEGPECKHVGGDWTCFFLPMSGCEQVLKKSGKQVQVDFDKLTTFDDNLIPEQFRHVGIAYWWGIVQERMFRLQPPVRQYILSQSNRMQQRQGHVRARGAKTGFPGITAAQLEPGWLITASEIERRAFAAPIAGMHVRHGDKHSDGFKHHSLEMELRAVQASKQCEARESGGDKADGKCWTHGALGARTSTETGSVAELLPIFVASDDFKVLSSAAELGFLVDGEGGVSQSTHSTGMLSTLLNKPELGYNASLEIIRDIFFLSRCTTLVGICASQIFRIAVDISTATGILESATAMDHAQLPRVAQMSAKYHLPLVEHFSLPPSS